MFSVHHLIAQQSPVILDLCLSKTRSGRSHDYRDVIVFNSKSPVFKMFFVHTKRKAGIFKFLRLEESFRKALRPHYPEEILKRRFPYENISNVLRPHYAGEISKLNNTW